MQLTPENMIQHMCPQVFVYGSLRRGMVNSLADYADEAHYMYIGNGSIVGSLYTSEFPYVVLGGQSKVRGEVYVVTPALLRELDRVEGIAHVRMRPYWYRRASVCVTLDSGDERMCETYVWDEAYPGSTPIAHGDYVRYYTERYARIWGDES